jgi:hypothetical protein
VRASAHTQQRGPPSIERSAADEPPEDPSSAAAGTAAVAAIQATTATSPRLTRRHERLGRLGPMDCLVADPFMLHLLCPASHVKVFDKHVKHDLVQVKRR